MTNYVPREGDTVKVELTVTTYLDGRPCVHLQTPEKLRELIAAGKVELIARAEPDWQPGDIGQHVETGALFAYDPRRDWPAGHPDCAPWIRVLAAVNIHGHTERRAFRDKLAGKLVRMRLVPEDDK